MHITKKIYFFSILELLLSCFSVVSAEEYRHDLIYLVDKENGCFYIKHKETITPRLAPNGSIYCLNKDKINLIGSYEKVIVNVDTETGCNYVQSYDSNGLTARLNKDNKIICN